MKRYAFLFWLGLCMTLAAAQDLPAQAGDEEESPFAHVRQNVMRLMGSLQQLGDWEQHYPLIIESTEKVYARNGWDSEPDRFSLGLIREVSAIPPWQPMERFDAVTQILSDRYLLDEAQEEKMRQLILAQEVDLFRRHSGRIAEYAIDAIQTRAAGEAFTPEKVARWMQLAQPVFQDARTGMQRSAKEFMGVLDEDQQALLQADLQAAERRLDNVETMSQEWARGEWDPADWGMEEDPIQLAGEARAAEEELAAAEQRALLEGAERQPDAAAGPGAGRRAGAAGGAPGAPVQPTTPQAAVQGPLDDWAQYVQRFIQKFQLNESQQAQAWKIYRAVQVRRESYEKRFKEQSEQLKRGVTGSEADQARLTAVQADQKQALDRLFDQLRRRLDRLPTRAQRRDAKPIELEPQPAGKPTTAPRYDGP